MSQKIIMGVISLFVMANSSLAQNITITGPGPSDKYIQHQVIKMGDEFVFTNQNTNKRNSLAAFDEKNTAGNDPAFKMFYPEKKEEIYFFRLRHPLVIEPYTSYELAFQYKATEIKGKGPFLEITVYDDTRETLVESHKITISEDQNSWKQQTFQFKTNNKARFARLLIKSNGGGAGKVLVSEVILKQVSTPQALKPVAQKILEVKAWKPGQLFASSIGKLPADKEYYSVSFNMKWENFTGSSQINIEWLADEKSGSAIVADKFEITSIEGILPSWNGVEAEWKRVGLGKIDFISRGKNKLFNLNKEGGYGVVVFRLDKPAGASFIRISEAEKNSIKGVFEIQNLSIAAEY